VGVATDELVTSHDGGKGAVGRRAFESVSAFAIVVGNGSVPIWHDGFPFLDFFRVEKRFLQDLTLLREGSLVMFRFLGRF
jgi:hypothetical protein